MDRGDRPRLAGRLRVHGWYLKGDKLVAALAVNRSDDLEVARELIKSGEPVDREKLP